MPDTVSWTRCGNTPFYRRTSGPFPGGFYVNPFNWTQVSVGSAREGSFDVILRRAARYDWERAKENIYKVSSDRQEQLRILQALHEWHHDLFKAKEMGLPFREIRSQFEIAPPEAQAAVLEGVATLLDAPIEEHIHGDPGITDRTILVIIAGSPAHAVAEDIASSYPNLDRIVIAETLEAGLDDALGDFGIYECS